jgi:hypothetical protein
MQSALVVWKNAWQQIFPPAAWPRLKARHLSRWHSTKQLLFDDSKPMPAQPLAQDVYREMVTPTDATTASAGTPLLIGKALFHRNKPDERRHVRLSS